ncbi:hypothetical protein MNBD_DELTA01-1327 [hydrothermal vent metagenome]|uniref:Uncharacterized protein n=1 Tax=hydrothermal vent metagenome TaxID=652676 RepID=A0A3B0RKF8_9ZZZZ
MVGIAEVSMAYSGIKTAIDIVIQIKDAPLKKAEMNLKLIGLMNALADVKSSTAKFQALILEKDSEIKELKDALCLEKEMRYEAPYYWRDTESGKEGPFCQKCYDSDKKAIRLQKGCIEGAWECKTCEKEYRDLNYKDVSFTAMAFPGNDPDE